MGVAKVLIIDEQDRYLMMWRSDHPHFGTDADLPGGTIEDDETPLLAAVREVEEEAGILISESNLELLYDGTEYSTHGEEIFLYLMRSSKRPLVRLSWEHSSYQWIPREEFLEAAENAKDNYMHMVYEVVSQHKLKPRT